MTEISEDDQTKLKLMKAAAAEFTVCGFQAANVYRISQKAGFGKRLIEDHFASKEELLLAILEQASHEIVRACQAPETDSTKQRLVDASKANLLWVKKSPAFARIVLDEMFTAKPDFHQKALEAFKALVEKIQSILSEGQRKGELRTDRPLDLLALTFLGLQNLALLQYWGTSGRALNMDEIPELTAGQFLDGATP